MKAIRGFNLELDPELADSYSGPKACPRCGGVLRLDIIGPPPVLLIRCPACPQVIAMTYRDQDSTPRTILREDWIPNESKET